MKKIVLLFLLLVTGCNSRMLAQSIPLPSIHIGDGMYVDETEVDVATWLSYYSWTVVHEGEEKAKETLPDSNLIEPELWNYIRNKSIAEYLDVRAKYSDQPIGYFRKQCQEYSKFRRRLERENRYCSMLNFPVTGVTYEQVQAFCKWRTQVMGAGQYEYALPAPQEWRQLTMFSLTKREKQNGMKDSSYKKVSPAYNFNFKSYCPTCIEAGTLMGVGMFFSDEGGFFDVWGNVSEMTAEKGVSMGGNFMLYASQCHPDSVQRYSGPQRWLGFRCIAKRKAVAERGKQEQLEEHALSPTSEYAMLQDPRDNNVYPIVIVGKQTWMAANLAYKPDSGKYWVHNNDEANVGKYGYLYSWPTAMNACPAGWHLPGKEEFDTLLAFIKAGGTDHELITRLRPGGGSGMSVIDAGVRYGFNYTPIDRAVFWTSSVNKKTVWGLGISGTPVEISFYDGHKKNSGLSVRCVKNTE